MLAATLYRLDPFLRAKTQNDEWVLPLEPTPAAGRLLPTPARLPVLLLPALLRRVHAPASQPRRHFSRLLDRYGFVAPASLTPAPRESPNPDAAAGKKRRAKRPPTAHPGSKPIGLREPKYSPFGPGRLDRPWTGLCAPAVDATLRDVDAEDPLPDAEKGLEEARRRERERLLGEPLTPAERAFLVDKCQKNRTKRQINLGRDGLTHNMLDDIHNNWKSCEAVRIKCLGVPTVDMENVCHQLEDKSGGLIIHRKGGLLILYRGGHYNPKKRPVIPLMLWKRAEPIYPRLIKTTIEGLTVEETKQRRKKGLHVPVLTKLAKNGYYASLVPMVRDAFLADELVRVDCKVLPKSDFQKIGVKLRDLVPCILVSFDKEQIIVWHGKDYDGNLRDQTQQSLSSIIDSNDALIKNESGDQEPTPCDQFSECSEINSPSEYSEITSSDESVISDLE